MEKEYPSKHSRRYGIIYGSGADDLCIGFSGKVYK